MEQQFTGSGAEILVECLVRAGVKVLFGLPGDTGITLYDALYRRQEAIRHVLVRDERHGAVAADAYARCTNQVGVVEASSGGGVTYLLSGLGEPFAASVPVLAITTDIRSSSKGTNAITEIDQELLFTAVTKWRATVRSTNDIPRLVAKALSEATSGRPGPVSLIFPEEVLDEQGKVLLATENTAGTEGGVFTPMLSDSHLPVLPSPGEAAELLSQAERPAILAGGGVHLAEAWEALRELAEGAGIPVATSIHGKGAFAETSPWSLGVVGANGARPYSNAYMATADVVLLVGTRANATDTNSYKGPARGNARVIHIEVDPARAGRNYPDSLTLVGDARLILEQLADLVAPAEAARSERLLAEIGAEREQWYAAEALPRTVAPGLLDPREVVQTIARLAGPEVTLVGEPGTATPNIAAYWEVATAGRRVLIPRGHGAMGFAIPGAIGAAMARPGEPIIGLTGDGSFAMACGELETACRLQLPIIYLQFTNASFGWIKMLQHLYTEGRYFNVDPGPIDAVLVAQAMGLTAYRASSIEHFAELFTQALASGMPTYIDIPVPDEITLTPLVAPWQATLAGKAGRTAY
jgi:acetolactate synthase I/II/III large subunit